MNDSEIAIQRGWMIQAWPADGTAPPPSVARKFHAEHTSLLIARVPDKPQTYSLTWLDEHLCLCTLHGFRPDGQGNLVATDKNKLLGGEEYQILLAFDSRGLTGEISVKSKDQQDEVVGTFTATANPGGARALSYRKSLHWPGWLRRLFHRRDESRLAQHTVV